MQIHLFFELFDVDTDKHGYLMPQFKNMRSVVKIKCSLFR